jgi:hypothetical protein
MIRISTVFIAICMVLVAASLGLILYSVLGISGSESAIVALTALTFLILYNAVSMRLRDRTDVGGQIADLSRGTADLARQVAEFGRRLAAIGLMMWMWMSAIIVLCGAELNSENEHQTARDTTVGPPKPLGARGAEMADTLGPAVPSGSKAQ